MTKIEVISKSLDIDFKTNSSYFDAIAFNDSTKVKTIISDANDKQRNTLLNGSFRFGVKNTSRENFRKDSEIRVCIPLHLALCFASKEVAKIFLEYNVDVLSVDGNGGNVLHSLVTHVSANNKRNEETEAKACRMTTWLFKR